MNTLQEGTGRPVRVYFLGSGRLGVPAIRALLSDQRIELAGLGTQPDRRAGRHRHLVATDVGEVGVTLGLPVDKPESANAESFAQRLRDLGVELVVVASYGQILKPHLLAIPPHGFLNLHASLLPRYRGAAPVAAAILNGDVATGVSFMQIDPGLDTGPVYAQYRVDIGDSDTTASVKGKIAARASDHVSDCVWQICREGMEAVPQDASVASHAPKVKKRDGVIDWGASATYIERMTRAYYPWPRAVCFVRGKRGRIERLQILEGVVEAASEQVTSGTVTRVDKHGFAVACGDGVLGIVRVVPQGRREMTAAEFVRGHSLEPGTVLPSGPQEDETV